MENPTLAAECGSPLIRDLIDAYQREKDNPFAEKRCKHPHSIRSHLKPARELWGAMTLAEFSRGSKARVKDAVEAWRRAGEEALCDGPRRDPPARRRRGLRRHGESAHERVSLG